MPRRRDQRPGPEGPRRVLASPTTWRAPAGGVNVPAQAGLRISGRAAGPVAVDAGGWSMSRAAGAGTHGGPLPLPLSPPLPQEASRDRADRPGRPRDRRRRSHDRGSLRLRGREVCVVDGDEHDRPVASRQARTRPERCIGRGAAMTSAVPPPRISRGTTGPGSTRSGMPAVSVACHGAGPTSTRIASTRAQQRRERPSGEEHRVDRVIGVHRRKKRVRGGGLPPGQRHTQHEDLHRLRHSG